MVLISKKNRRTILEFIFKEGVITVQKDGSKPKHDDIDVPNLEVMMLTKSLVSRNYLKDTFNWQWHYCFLTNEGIEYLREVLHLPPHVAPQTLTKQRAARPLGATSPPGGGDSFGGKGWSKGKDKGRGKGWGKDGPVSDEKPSS
eukprot:GEMP01126167.1.p1 GENE.GEMP01126167.1~~GEMP01126167.1.p1  ORF type:complete len:144 (+),score=39.03 GEMP01126167.1:60-491(+)